MQRASKEPASLAASLEQSIAHNESFGEMQKGVRRRRAVKEISGVAGQVVAELEHWTRRKVGGQKAERGNGGQLSKNWLLDLGKSRQILTRDFF
jgi:hypothetical protein